MNRLYWLTLAVLVAILLACGAYAKLHPSQPWNFYPPSLPVGTDELLYPNQV